MQIPAKISQRRAKEVPTETEQSAAIARLPREANRPVTTIHHLQLVKTAMEALVPIREPVLRRRKTRLTTIAATVRPDLIPIVLQVRLQAVTTAALLLIPLRRVAAALRRVAVAAAVALRPVAAVAEGKYEFKNYHNETKSIICNSALC